MSSKRSKPDRGAAARATDAEAARAAVRTAFKGVRDRNDLSDPATRAWLAAIDRFDAALDAAYPAGFWDDLARLGKGDGRGTETIISFLEDDPFFFRSGYAKERALKFLARAGLDKVQAGRLRNVCLAVVDGRDRREFRNYCRLAARLDHPALRAGLDERLASADEGVRRRAGWMRDALGRGPAKRL